MTSPTPSFASRPTGSPPTTPTALNLSTGGVADGRDIGDRFTVIVAYHAFVSLTQKWIRFLAAPAACCAVAVLYSSVQLQIAAVCDDPSREENHAGNIDS
jgi:hypothetical protein